MFVAIIKNNGQQYVSVRATQRLPNGKIKTVVLENYGRLDICEEKDPDFLKKLYARVDELNAQEKLSKKTNRQVAMSKMMEGEIKTNAMSVCETPLQCGHFALRKIWRDDLGLHTTLDYWRKKKTNSEIDYAKLIETQVLQKLIEPASVLRTFDERTLKLGNPLENCKLEQLYDALDFLNDIQPQLTQAINKRVTRLYGSERLHLVFFDVTNAYFETPMTDAERQWEAADFPDQVNQYAQTLRNQERLSQDYFDSDGYPIVEALPAWFWDEVSREKLEFFRMRGPSKEHRHDLPIVSIALAIDERSVPVDWFVFAGNTSEYKSLERAIDALKERHQIDDSVVVADRGINSVNNLLRIKNHGNGFLVAQKISQLPEWMYDKILDESLYAPIDPANPEFGRYQVFNDYKRKNAQGQTISCKLIVTFDEARYRRDNAILDMWVELVKAKQAQGVRLGRSRHGWASLAKTESDEAQEIIGIDEKVLAHKRRLCGFAGMVYEPPQNADTNTISDARLASKYRMLNMIENGFLILKSHLGLRPMFVRKSTRIKGHVSLCMLALIILRILQSRLEAQGTPMSIQALMSTLNKASVLPVKMGEEILYFRASGTRRLTKQEQQMDPKTFVEKVKEKAIELRLDNQIFQAVGLEGIPDVSTRSSLARALGTKSTSDKSLIPEPYYSLMCV